MKENHMFNKHTVEIDWGGRPLKLETGKIARQADGAVVATYGESVVLATVVAAKSPREGVDFLPLTVDYQEKTYAAGVRTGRVDPKITDAFGPMILQLIGTAAELARSLPTKGL